MPGYGLLDQSYSCHYIYLRMAHVKTTRGLSYSYFYIHVKLVKKLVRILTIYPLFCIFFYFKRRSRGVGITLILHIERISPRLRLK